MYKLIKLILICVICTICFSCKNNKDPQVINESAKKTSQQLFDRMGLKGVMYRTLEQFMFNRDENLNIIGYYGEFLFINNKSLVLATMCPMNNIYKDDHIICEGHQDNMGIYGVLAMSDYKEDPMKHTVYFINGSIVKNTTNISNNEILKLLKIYRD